MADILIHGISIPRERDHLTITINADGTVQPLVDMYCPIIAHAIELPEQGDLIERDALKHKFCAHCDGYEYDTGACADGDQDCMDAKIIMNAPVIVPASKEETE